jgi:hypothetical protein
MTHDKIYYFLPYWDNKPCMHIRSVWPDYRRRMYNSNIISKIAEKLVSINELWKMNHNCYVNSKKDDGLSEVNSSIESDDSEAETRLKQVLEDLSIGCTKYVTISQASVTGPGTGKTKLDKEHLKLCQREIVSIRVVNI